MQTGEPTEAGGQASPEGVETADAAKGSDQTEATVAQPAPDPILKGEPLTLWATLLVPLVVFFIVIMMIIRGSARASKRRAATTIPDDFFQPAGEGADISFEDEDAGLAEAKPAKGKKKREKEKAIIADSKTASRNKKRADEAEVVFETAESKLHQEPLFDEPSLRASEAPAQREGGLAGFFGKGKKKSAAAERTASAHIEVAPADDREHETAFHHAEETPRAKKAENAWAKLSAADSFAESETHSSRHGDDEAGAARRQVEEEFRRIEDDRRAAIEREAEFERRKHMAALDQQRRSIEDQERSLAEQAYAVDRQFEELRRDLADELDARFEAIAARVEEKLSHASASDASPSGAASEDQISAIAELISRRLGEERDAFDGAIAALSNRLEAVADRADAAADLRQEIAALKRSVSSLSAHGLAGRSAAPSAPTVQLADVIRAALPAKSYEMRALLSNGRRADCLIRLPHLAGPIAVDGQFPAEAFLRLRAPGAAESLRAENEFRRAALRHIADVAEHLIVPGETADSALLFIPSETLYSEFHSRFPDVIQDSYRARVWIVSPTTMMATLHAMRAALRNIAPRAEPARGDDAELLSELTALRSRFASLKGRFDEDEDVHEPRVSDVLIEEREEYAEPDYSEEDVLAHTDETEAESALEDDDEAEPEIIAQSIAHKSERRDSSEGDLWTEEQTPPKPGAPFPLR